MRSPRCQVHRLSFDQKPGYYEWGILALLRVQLLLAFLFLCAETLVFAEPDGLVPASQPVMSHRGTPPTVQTLTQPGHGACGVSVDLYDQPPHSPLLQVPVKDQGHTHMCYAESVSEMVDYVRAVDRPTMSSSEMARLSHSTVYAAFIYSTRVHVGHNGFTGGGNEVPLFNHLGAHGTCSSEGMNRALSAVERVRVSGSASRDQTAGDGEFEAAPMVDHRLKMSDPDFILLLDQVAQWRRSGGHPLNEHQIATHLHDLMRGQTAQDRVLSQSVNDLLSTQMGDPSNFCSIADLSHYITLISQMGEPVERVLSQEIMRHCQGVNLDHPALPRMNKINAGSDSLLASQLSDQLRRGHPSMLQLCSNILPPPAGRGTGNERLVSESTPPQTRGISSKCGSHTLLPVAQKEIGGQCQVLLRNSWGQWHPSNKVPTAGGGWNYYPECAAAQAATAGVVWEGCWVPRDRLLKNLYGLSAY